MFAGNLLDPGSISVRLRELVILRTCARCGCEYEWGVHVALFAQQADLRPDDIASTLQIDRSRLELPPSERMLFDVVDELHDTSTIGDQTWAALTAQFSTAQILEVIALVGTYHAVSFQANALNLDPEPFAPRFSVYLQR
ncbi:carboxymuconolactone decarboxylase family protein [Deinococcus hohokamensis]|uniref:Carboxymuconolactone decarboxylase family protein n=1 Tax=Deinococcus hohokamensis TaxID=309883 RepID=A0ABV9I642_9DEIO